ncbi:unnamed protein product, partial [Ranitomeya imitator]
VSEYSLSPVNIAFSFFDIGMIEHGLTDSSHYRPRQSIAEEELPVVAFSQDGNLTPSLISSPKDEDTEIGQDSLVEPSKPEVSGREHGVDVNGSIEHLRPPSHTSPESVESDWETLDPSILEECLAADEGEVWNVGPGPCELLTNDTMGSGSVPITVQPQSKTGQAVFTPGLISGLEEDKYGMPLAIFTKGYLCLPYMALQQHHLLSDVSVRGFVAGATNILFRQQKHLSDAIVEVEDARLNIHDPELRKILNPTTADLRFIDHLVKHVTENRDDVFLDGTGWEGGDEWIRAQFALYLHSLLSASAQPENEKMLSDYGSAFISMWKITHNYRVWNSNKHPALSEVNPCTHSQLEPLASSSCRPSGAHSLSHPFQGNYSVSDVKLRLSHSVQNSERGKKLGNAVVTTSRNMVQTGKAVGQSVGGALISAKSAMSSWLSTFSQPSTQEQQEENQ